MEAHNEAAASNTSAVTASELESFNSALSALAHQNPAYLFGFNGAHMANMGGSASVGVSGVFSTTTGGVGVMAAPTIRPLSYLTSAASQRASTFLQHSLAAAVNPHSHHHHLSATGQLAQLEEQLNAQTAAATHIHATTSSILSSLMVAAAQHQASTANAFVRQTNAALQTAPAASLNVAGMQLNAANSSPFALLSAQPPQPTHCSCPYASPLLQQSVAAATTHAPSTSMAAAAAAAAAIAAAGQSSSSRLALLRGSHLAPMPPQQQPLAPSHSSRKRSAAGSLRDEVAVRAAKSQRVASYADGVRAASNNRAAAATLDVVVAPPPSSRLQVCFFVRLASTFFERSRFQTNAADHLLAAVAHATSAQQQRQFTTTASLRLRESVTAATTGATTLLPSSLVEQQSQQATAPSLGAASSFCARCQNMPPPPAPLAASHAQPSFSMYIGAQPSVGAYGDTTCNHGALMQCASCGGDVSANSVHSMISANAAAAAAAAVAVTDLPAGSLFAAPTHVDGALGQAAAAASANPMARAIPPPALGRNARFDGARLARRPSPAPCSLSSAAAAAVAANTIGARPDQMALLGQVSLTSKFKTHILSAFSAEQKSTKRNKK